MATIALVGESTPGYYEVFDTMEEYNKAMGLTVELGEGEVTVTEKSVGVPKTTKAKTSPIVSDGSAVSFKIGHTKNLGNYESLRIEVSITMPCTVDTVDQTYAMCKEWSDEKLTEAVDEVNAEIGE